MGNAYLLTSGVISSAARNLRSLTFVRDDSRVVYDIATQSPISVGWVEARCADTIAQELMGIALLNPSYELLRVDCVLMVDISVPHCKDVDSLMGIASLNPSYELIVSFARHLESCLRLRSGHACPGLSTVSISVGWVERRAPIPIAQELMGIALLNPSYELIVSFACHSRENGTGQESRLLPSCAYVLSQAASSRQYQGVYSFRTTRIVGASLGDSPGPGASQTIISLFNSGTYS